MFDQIKKARAMKKAMGAISVTGEAVDGKIKVTVDGTKEVKDIDIAADLLTPENKEPLENGIMEALKSCDKELQREMIGKVQSGEISLGDLTG